MGRCLNHKDVETDIVCLKDGAYYCDECAACRNPNNHCKFRRSCAIWHAAHVDQERGASERRSGDEKRRVARAKKSGR